MMIRRGILVVGSSLAALSCTHTTVTPTPSPAGSPPARTAAQGRAGGPGRRPAPLSRDSLAKLRSVYVAQVMSQIAGRENQPAEQVFKNVRVLKGITAGELVQKMDKEYSAGLSWNCSNCHRFAAQGDFASDTSNNKVRARFMQQLVNVINTEQLPKLYPRNTPKVTCATCHRGYNEPPPAQYLIPERGQPGGPPAFGRRPGR